MVLRIKGVSLETVDKWLHQVENGRSIIDTLINMGYRQRLRCGIADFQKIDPSVKNNAEFTIINFLNDYFEEHKYPFKANYERKEEPLSISIKKTKALLDCPVHNIHYKTESDLVEHQKCSFESKTEQKEHSNNIVIEDEDRETNEQKMRKREEERRAIEGNVTR